MITPVYHNETSERFYFKRKWFRVFLNAFGEKYIKTGFGYRKYI